VVGEVDGLAGSGVPGPPGSMTSGVVPGCGSCSRPPRRWVGAVRGIWLDHVINTV
jgi:hypothetical protein